MKVNKEEVSKKTIWKELYNGKYVDEIYEGIPDEYYNFIKETSDELFGDYERIYKQMCDDFFQVFMEVEFVPDKREFNKNFANLATKFQYPQLLFAMRDKKSDQIPKMIWKILEPK